MDEKEEEEEEEEEEKRKVGKAMSDGDDLGTREDYRETRGRR